MLALLDRSKRPPGFCRPGGTINGEFRARTAAEMKAFEAQPNNSCTVVRTHRRRGTAWQWKGKLPAKFEKRKARITQATSPAPAGHGGNRPRRTPKAQLQTSSMGVERKRTPAWPLPPPPGEFQNQAGRKPGNFRAAGKNGPQRFSRLRQIPPAAGAATAMAGPNLPRMRINCLKSLIAWSYKRATS